MYIKQYLTGKFYKELFNIFNKSYEIAILQRKSLFNKFDRLKKLTKVRVFKLLYNLTKVSYRATES